MGNLAIAYYKTDQYSKSNDILDELKQMSQESSVGSPAFYIAMLAWPFGLSEQGYIATRALLAGSVMFAISIPAWFINIKRD